MKFNRLDTQKMRVCSEFLEQPAPGVVQELLDELERQYAIIDKLADYFTSGNQVPVDRAVIKQKDFCLITGMLI